MDRFAFLLVTCLAAADEGGEAAREAEALRHFELKVRPVLVERCEKCHGVKKQWGGLRVDRRDALLKGGDSGPAVVPGKPDESLLVRAIRHQADAPQMPEDGKLSDAQIRDFELWVERGAAFPASIDAVAAKKREEHWSYQPLAAPSLPAVRAADWPRTWIDAFLLAEQESHELTPNVAADRATLIRRLTFDLLGLPPTVEQVEAFLADDSVDAAARLVDRLLASPAYGERWGRHWLDVARYADSNGLDENIAHGNAWRYRDYIVRSFNQDKPYSQLIREQLAGDLLAGQFSAASAAEDGLSATERDAKRNELMIATGFLSIGPKVLAEVDEAKMRMDIVDEQLDTTGRALLGMTLGCARCHDHKFDPISTADYYALAGVFKSTKSMETYTKVARWKENPLALPEVERIKTEFAKRVAEKKAAIETLVAQASDDAKRKLRADEKPPENLETLFPAETQAKLKALRDETAALEKEGPELPTAMGVGEDAVVDLAIHIRGNPLKLGEVSPRRVPVVIQGPKPPTFPSDRSGRLELADWLLDPAHPLTARVIVNRVWRWHFGRGLVRTTDNFGLLGEAPSHPALLDALARRFMAGGWSFKSLHRELTLSAAFAQSSAPSADSLTKDPDNRWYSRGEVQRLGAEQVRDALLEVSDERETQLGGTLLKVKNRGYLFDHTSIDKTDYSSRRRSLYLPVIRNNVYDVFQLLDFPDPAISTGDRATTVVAPQALLMMNSDFVMHSAMAMANRLQREAADESQRLKRLYLAAFAREATAEELREAADFLVRADRMLEGSEPDAGRRRQEAWCILCHVTLAANEFLYLR
ncbi:MAG: PSD1 and planctomycete cytochrome C domain-containing protein [Pirellulales bacterium]